MQAWDIILITNRAGVDTMSLADRIIDACVADLGPPLEDVAGTNITGLYYDPETGSTLQLLEHGGRQLIGLGGATLPARRDAEGKLHSAYRIFDAVVEAPPGDPAPKQLTYSQWGKPEVLTRLEPGARPDMAARAGVYASASTGTSGVLAVDGDQTTLTFTGRWNTVPLQPHIHGRIPVARDLDQHGAFRTGRLRGVRHGRRRLRLQRRSHPSPALRAGWSDEPRRNSLRRGRGSSQAAPMSRARPALSSRPARVRPPWPLPPNAAPLTSAMAGGA